MQVTAALLLLGAAHALQINHIFRRPTPFLNEKNTFTEDDGYKLLEGYELLWGGSRTPKRYY